MNTLKWGIHVFKAQFWYDDMIYHTVLIFQLLQPSASSNRYSIRILIILCGRWRQVYYQIRLTGCLPSFRASCVFRCCCQSRLAAAPIRRRNPNWIWEDKFSKQTKPAKPSIVAAAQSSRVGMDGIVSNPNRNPSPKLWSGCVSFFECRSLLVETPSTHPTPYHTIPSQSTQHHSIPLYSLYTLLHYLATWVGHVSYRVFQCFFGPFGCCLLLVLFAFRWLACICICAEDIALVTSRRRRLCVTKSHIKTFIRNLFKLGCLRCATSKVLYLFIYISSFLENQRGLIII